MALLGAICARAAAGLFPSSPLFLFSASCWVWLLIVVMAVMNGFRADLLDRILGVSGHVCTAVERAI